MGKTITLHCEETPGLKLGPGVVQTVRTVQLPGDTEPLVAGDVIVFSNGFATFDADEFPDWERWVRSAGTPAIRVIDEAAGEATGAETETPVECPICQRTFKTEFGLKGHLRSHASVVGKQSNAKTKAK